LIWIRKKQSEVRLKKEEIVDHKYLPGELFYYLGKTYPLLVIDKGKSLIFKGDSFILPEKYTHKVRDFFIKWYKEQAKSVISHRIEHFAPVIGAKPKSVRIKALKTRWGSCSSRQNLNFNYRIIMAPPAVLDYVVVHEMCHLIHPNHSSDFWGLVKLIMPNHDDCHQWLRKNTHKLYL